MAGFIARRIAAFKVWWRAPATRKDRVLGAVVGLLGGFWIGLFAGAIIVEPPVPLLTFMWWPIGGMAAGLLGGICFPKITTCVCFPFSLFGFGNS